MSTSTPLPYESAIAGFLKSANCKDENTKTGLQKAAATYFDAIDENHTKAAEEKGCSVVEYRKAAYEKFKKTASVSEVALLDHLEKVAIGEGFNLDSLLNNDMAQSIGGGGLGGLLGLLLMNQLGSGGMGQALGGLGGGALGMFALPMLMKAFGLGGQGGEAGTNPEMDAQVDEIVNGPLMQEAVANQYKTRPVYTFDSANQKRDIENMVGHEVQGTVRPPTPAATVQAEQDAGNLFKDIQNELSTLDLGITPASELSKPTATTQGFQRPMLNNLESIQKAQKPNLKSLMQADSPLTEASYGASSQGQDRLFNPFQGASNTSIGGKIQSGFNKFKNTLKNIKNPYEIVN